VRSDAVLRESVDITPKLERIFLSGARFSGRRSHAPVTSRTILGIPGGQFQRSVAAVSREGMDITSKIGVNFSVAPASEGRRSHTLVASRTILSNPGACSAFRGCASESADDHQKIGVYLPVVPTLAGVEATRFSQLATIIPARDIARRLGGEVGGRIA
jgi:hypothetical protein